MDPEFFIRQRYADAKFETLGALEEPVGSQRCAAAGRALQRVADAGLRKIPESFPAEEPLACARGCCWCCYGGRVGVTIPEAAAIAELLSTFPESERNTIQQSLRAATNELRKGGSSLRWRERAPCPFLDETIGECRVYPLRPTKCRGWTAYDQDACRRSYEAGGNADPTILISNLRMEVCTGSTGGHIDALAEHGLDGDTYDLEPAVLAHLLDEDAPQQWLGGAKWTKDQVIRRALQLAPGTVRNEGKRLRRQQRRKKERTSELRLVRLQLVTT